MAGAAFSKQLRLLNPAQFRAVFDQPPYRVAGGEILLLARPNSLAHSRMGIVIGKKACRLACQRNRFKRLVRESFRQNHDSLAGLDIIVLARNGIADLDNSTITQRTNSLWIRLLKRSSALQGAPAAAVVSPAP